MLEGSRASQNMSRAAGVAGQSAGAGGGGVEGIISHGLQASLRQLQAPLRGRGVLGCQTDSTGAVTAVCQAHCGMPQPPRTQPAPQRAAPHRSRRAPARLVPDLPAAQTPACKAPAGGSWLLATAAPRRQRRGAGRCNMPGGCCAPRCWPIHTIKQPTFFTLPRTPTHPRAPCPLPTHIGQQEVRVIQNVWNAVLAELPQRKGGRPAHSGAGVAQPRHHLGHRLPQALAQRLGRPCRQAPSERRAGGGVGVAAISEGPSEHIRCHSTG